MCVDFPARLFERDEQVESNSENQCKRVKVSVELPIYLQGMCE